MSWAPWRASTSTTSSFLLGVPLLAAAGGDGAMLGKLFAFFLKAGSLVEAKVVIGAAGLIGAFLGMKMLTKFVGILPLTKAFRFDPREGMYTTLLMFTGLTFGTISALFGLTNHIIDQRQYTIGGPFLDYVGYPSEQGEGKTKANATLSWEYRQWTVGWTTTYYGAYYQLGAPGDPAFFTAFSKYPLAQGGNTIPSQTYHQLFASYVFDKAAAGRNSGLAHNLLSNLTVQLGIKNLFNTPPPFDAYNAPFFYSFYGAILYVIGPIVLSLLPAFGLGALARSYIINLMTFHFWGVIYSILGALITAVNIGTVQQVLSTGGFMGGFVGVDASLLLGLASIFYSISLAVIPFLASRIVHGETFGTIAHVILNKIPLIPRR